MSLLGVVRSSLVRQQFRPATALRTTANRFSKLRYMSSSTNNPNDDYEDEDEDDLDTPIRDSNDPIVYESPFAMLTTRLKAVSISSAVVGAIGVPMLIHFYSGEVPALGQYAVGGSTMLAACGSTVAINFCFAPYIHTLEKVPVRKCSAPTVDEGTEKSTTAPLEEDRAAQEFLVKATWRNFTLMKQETVFDPAVDVTEYDGIRPFCNFVAKDVPMYIHPEILHDDALRTQLLGEEVSKRYSMPNKDNRKDDEDELF